MSNRIKAALVHSGISIVILSMLLGWILLVWYPTPLVKAMGVTHLIGLITFIHVVVAPLLTLLIYKSGKKTLIFDLSIIVIIQTIALGYGVWSVAQGRPAWIVYDLDSFEVVRPIDIDQSDKIPKIKNKYQQPSWFKPHYVAIQLNKDNTKEFTDDVLGMMFGASMLLKIERYTSLDRAKVRIQETAQDLELLKQFNDPQAVQKTLAKYPQADSFVPLKATAVDMTVLINKETGEVVKIVDLRPWE
ncbi:hypothetical protein F991_03135 [Acinetobacter sp. CIP-A165]|uniref:TfpX/TfpZ family type IV pilin accessory protein n=1 Tax=Acinetobacter sp. CIP-A165 TaxID=40373 RepID=UPI0002CEB603|nr:TfpX/TfpZ family type IV pilin accessory protein [Acinetobacter sp. CIP-A165]ENU29011.1 hypothetical protein F991_03135 [Acinetobacter sp. CIP-A165]